MNKEFLAKKKDINELKINKADKADLSILENSIDDLKTKNNEQDERIATLEDKTDYDTKDTTGVTRFPSPSTKLYLVGCPTDVFGDALGDTVFSGTTYTYDNSYILNGNLYINGKKIAYDEDKVNKVEGKGLSTNDYTTAEKTKLSGIAEGANKTVVDSELNENSTNPVQNKVISKNIDALLDSDRRHIDMINLNSSDIEALNNSKVNKVEGKGLSTNDYTTAEKTKLSGIAVGANKTVVDSHPSYESTNPVQNKVITSMLDNYCTLTKHDGDVDTLLSELRNKQDQIDLNSSDIEALNNSKVDKETISNIAGTGLEYADYIDSSGVRSIKINHKKGPVYETIGPDPTTHTPNYGESFKVGYAHYDKEGHIIMGSNATIKMPSVDSELNENSTNPVQNKVICNQIQLLADSHRTALDMINLNSSDIEALNNSKVDKVDGKGLISDSEITRLANVENYDDTQIKSDIALNRTALGMQCKNLLKNTAVTQTINGATVTVNSDKTVSVHGTTTSQPTLITITKAMTLKAHKKYCLTGAYSGSIQLSLRDTNMSRVLAEDNGNGVEYTPNKDIEAIVLIRIGIIALDSPVTLYPMLRYADITDNTYEPYQPSLQEQINQLSDTSNSGKLLYSMSEVVSSPLTVNITGLFTAYTVVVCNVVTSDGKYSLILPLQYIKSLGASSYYEAESIMFHYIDDNKIKISTGRGQSNPTINIVRIINLL